MKLTTGTMKLTNEVDRRDDYFPNSNWLLIVPSVDRPVTALWDK